MKRTMFFERISANDLKTAGALLGAFALSAVLLSACGSAGKSPETTAAPTTAAAQTTADASTAAATTAAETAAETAATATEGPWYQAVLEDASLRESYPYSCVMDLDQDGTEELFLSSTEKAFVGAEDQARLMALVDGAPAVLKEIGGAGGEVFKYDAADQSLFYYSRLSGEGHVTQMKLENGALKELVTVDCYQPNHGPEGGNPDSITWYLDGKKVSEEEATLLWNQYEEKAVEITYTK